MASLLLRLAMRACLMPDIPPLFALRLDIDLYLQTGMVTCKGNLLFAGL